MNGTGRTIRIQFACSHLAHDTLPSIQYRQRALEHFRTLELKWTFVRQIRFMTHNRTAPSPRP